jgi:hypothetical protein
VHHLRLHLGGPQPCAGGHIQGAYFPCPLYRSGRSTDWLKFKNPEAPAVMREAEEEWGTVTIAELLTQKDSSELLLITEPELSLRNRRSEWLCGGFLCDHPGSLDGRVRNDAADCADAAKCDADCNDQSNGELLAAALAHGERLHQASERTIQSPAWAHCGSPPLAQL